MQSIASTPDVVTVILEPWEFAAVRSTLVAHLPFLRRQVAEAQARPGPLADSLAAIALAVENVLAVCENAHALGIYRYAPAQTAENGPQTAETP